MCPPYTSDDAAARCAEHPLERDFVRDAPTDGRRFRMLAIVDDNSRACLALVADTSLSEPWRHSRTRHRDRPPKAVLPW